MKQDETTDLPLV